MKAMGLVVSDKKIFEDLILTTQGSFLLSLVKFPLAVEEKKSFEIFLI